MIDIFKFIQQRCFNTPLLLEAGKARVIADYLEHRFMHSASPEKSMREYENEVDYTGGMVFEARQTMAARVEDIVVIPICGTLVNRKGAMDAMSGLISHRAIRNELIAAANDSRVRAILLDIDSSGGEVEGNFDLARLIREINNEIKPVIAIANGSAFSGAFSLGVAAGEFYVTETGGVGSVGVIIQHIDYSEANEMMGINVTNIKFGENKDQFSSDFPLSEDAQAFLQREVDRTGRIFVNHVAQMRNISEEAVRSTEAGLLFGEDGVNIGFVDGVLSFDELLENMIGDNFEITQSQIQEDSDMFIKRDKDKQANADAAANVETENTETPQTAEDVQDEIEAEADALVDSSEHDTSEETERAASIATVCAEAGVADKTAEFIKSGMTLEQVNDKIEKDTQVRQACVLAGKPDRADEFIKSGASLSKVQETLLSELADAEGETEVSAHESVDKMKSDLEKAETKENCILADVKRRQEKAQSK